jgi:hypothetical protein
MDGERKVTKRLEELFELPESLGRPNAEDIKTTPEEITAIVEMSNLEKIENALTAVRGLEASDEEMDTLARQAVESYKDLMDLGMNVEPRHASEIFGVAERMLHSAITAKNAKVNKKLKMIDLQLKKAKLDMGNPEGNSSAISNGALMDRNELLDRLIKGTDKSITNAEETDE